MSIKYYKFCPICRSPLVPGKNTVKCTKCTFVEYNNTAACANTLVVNDGKVLLCVRKFDPHKGDYDLVGGFINPLEHPEKAAIRETREETGLKVKIVKLLGAYPDMYGDSGQPTMNFSYIVKIVGGKAKASDDAEKLEWVEIKDLPKFKIKSFKNTIDSLKDLYNLYLKEPDLFL